MSETKKAFTIIEVMIFLAFTGFMLALVFANSNDTIRRQQYRDSILSLQEFIQNQYSETINTRNTIPDGFNCVFNDSVLSIDNSGSYKRGQSNCILIGKYITTGDSLDGTRITSYPIVAIKSSNSSKLDLESIKQDYKVDYDKSNQIGLTDVYNITWNSSMKTKLGSSLQFSFAILHSPTSANIFTLVSNNSTAELSSLLLDSNSDDTDLTICLDKSNTNMNRMMGIKVNANSSNQAGVVYIGDGDTTGACS